MEVEHFVGIGAVLAVSVLLVWIVWSCFCHEKADPEEDEEDYDEDPGASDSFSSTHHITRTKVKTKDEVSDSRPEKEIQGEGVTKTRKNSTGYMYQTNKYGLNDPFGEWTSKDKNIHTTGSPALFRHVYPKSPLLKHKGSTKDKDKKDHSVINI